MSRARTSAGRGRLLAAASFAAATLIATCVDPALASVASTPDDTAHVRGGVYALAQAGDRMIVGGVFTAAAGQPRSNVAAIRSDGSLDPAFLPRTDGTVRALAVSADGTRVFLGGTFSEVDGVPRANLAAVDAQTGAVIDSWVADTGGASAGVLSLAVAGDRLFVGGRFSSIDGKQKGKLAAVDTATGDVVTWNTWVNGGVLEITTSPDGGRVWLGGEFTRVRGVERRYIGAVDPLTGALDAFAPSGDGGRIITIAQSPDADWFYAASDNNTVFAYRPGVSNDPVWRTKMSGNTQAMAVSETELYLGGHFSQFVDQRIPRPFLASVHASTGVATSWNTYAEGVKSGVWALVLEGPRLHAGGFFRSFAGTEQRGYARFTGP